MTSDLRQIKKAFVVRALRINFKIEFSESRVDSNIYSEDSKTPTVVSDKVSYFPEASKLVKY